MDSPYGERRFLELAESMIGLGRWRLDVASGQAHWSAAAYTVYGVDPETFRPGVETVLDLCEPRDREEVSRRIRTSIATGCAFEAQYRINLPGGAVRCIRSRAVCQTGPDGKVVALFGIVQDMTESVERFAALEQSADRYRRLSEDLARQVEIADTQARRAALAEEAAGMGHWRVDAVTREVSWSPMMYRIYGLDPAAPLDLPALLAMTASDEAEWARARLERVLTTGEGGESTLTCIRRADGSARYVRGHITAERGPDGAIRAALGTMADVTEHVNARRAVEASEARYKLLADNASDLVLQCDIAGRVGYASPSALRMTGYSPEALIGQVWCELLHPGDAERVQASVQEQLDTKTAHRSEALEYRFPHKDGRLLWFEGQPTLLFDSQTGEAMGFTAIIRDVSFRIATEAELLNARIAAEAATAAKADFLANMSHELRTPLTAVLGYSSLAAEQPELGPTTRDYLARALNGGQALLATINDILDFSKLEAGQVEIKRGAVDPGALAKDVLGLFVLQAAAKSLRLDYAGLDTLPAPMLIDADRLRQVLLNLIGNAVKFTIEGQVKVDGAYDTQTASLTFSVSDTGPGISDAGLERLFQRFSQVDGSPTRIHSGTGLGLAISKGVVEAMGGRIGVESAVGRGSRFWFSIPAEPGQAETRATQAPIDLGALLNGCRVLVVDDNTSNLSLVRAMLTPFGVVMEAAHNGLEAVASAAASPFDVILMDLRMPTLDGAGAARRIRAEGLNGATPIIAFSAEASAPLDEALFDDRVSKPLSAGQLLEALARAVDPGGPFNAAARA